MRFHLLGLAHLPTTKIYSPCAFTQKIIKLADILSDHEVMFYGVEGSQVKCSEFIQVLNKETFDEVYDYDWTAEQFRYSYDDLAYTTFNKNAISEIKSRSEEQDVLLVTFGDIQKPIADAVGLLTVESGVGYNGVFANHKVFESYAWMHHIYGSRGIHDGAFYDVVIPNCFYPEDFEYQETKEEYFLYLGRIISRKGIHIARETCQKLGVKLVVAGQLSDESVDLSGVEYVGCAGPALRRSLLSKAKALFAPTVYIEPFGGVTIEAALSGTPTITTDWGAFSETILHGKTGFRCRTLEQFCWAAKNIDIIKPIDCHQWAINNFSVNRVKLMYDEYFNQLSGLFGDGWYANKDRNELNWLRRY